MIAFSPTYPGPIRAAGQIPRVRQVVIPKCGHAPQIEKARLVNQLISKYLRDKLKTIPPDLDPYRFLSDSSAPHKSRAGFLPTPLNSRQADERFHAFSRQVPQAGDGHRQHRAE